MKVDTQQLWDEFAETGDVEIRNRLVEKYLYIVKYVADRLQEVWDIMADGKYRPKIVKSGTKELALELEEKGYDWVKKEAVL